MPITIRAPLAVLSLVFLVGCDDPKTTSTSAAAPSAAAPTPTAAPGLHASITTEADRDEPRLITIRVHVRDDDAEGNKPAYLVDFGDGTDVDRLRRPVAGCAIPPRRPRPPRPYATTLTFLHHYPVPGTYRIDARVETFTLCWGPPEELRFASTKVVIE